MLLHLLQARLQPARQAFFIAVVSQSTVRNTSTFAGHETILRDEVAQALASHPRQPASPLFVDATIGGGGHAAALLRLSPTCHVLGIDKDPDAVAHSRSALPVDRCTVVRGSYIDMLDHLQQAGLPRFVHGIVADLGFSSHQLDTPARGFAFKQDGPLDMRFDPTGPVKASDLVNVLPESELRRVLDTFGEEPMAGILAAAVVRRRSDRAFESTADLASVLSQCASASARAKGWSTQAGHNAVARCFQALRIAVNNEMGAVQKLLEVAPCCIDPERGGTLAFLTFHSLEDRLVKRAFAALVKDSRNSKSGGGWEFVHKGGFLTPCEGEVERNSRARSAKLRVIRRQGPGGCESATHALLTDCGNNRVSATSPRRCAPALAGVSCKPWCTSSSVSSTVS